MFDEEHGFDGPTCKQCGMVNCNSTRGCQRRQHNNKFRRTLDENASLRTQLATVTRERDERYDCRGGPGTTAPACGGCVTCLHRVIEATERERDEARAFAADREGLALQLDAAKETVQFGIELRQKAEADAARLREALTQVRDAMRATGQEPDGDDDPRRPVASAVWHALDSTPSDERMRAKAERWLGDGPEEPGGTLAFHAAPSAEPTPRDMRVAETALREASDMVRDADDGVPLDCLADSIDAIDRAAVVVKAVKS